MKIAVDYQSASGKKTGIGVAAANLMEAMLRQAPDIEWLLYQNGRQHLSAPQRILWESFEIPARLRQDKPNLLYSPGFAPPMWSPAPSVVTVHDLIGMAFPANQTPVSGFYWSKWLPSAVRRARRVVASSEWTKRDIERFLKIPADKIRVVPLGVDPSFRKLEDRSQIRVALKQHGISRPFFMNVSTLEPRKNHLRLLQAYESMKQQKYGGQCPFMLVLIGKDGGAETELRAFVKEKELASDVLFLGYVRQEELVCLYNAALGYIMVSLYEGFGLPVLEAMSCGLSGVCSDRTSLPEVAGETGMLVDPENPGAIGEAMVRLAENNGQREALSKAAYVRSRLFSTEQTAREMIEIFRNESQN